MGHGDGIDVSKAVRDALPNVDLDAPTEEDLRVVSLAAYLELLAERHGLSEHHEEKLAHRARQPTRFLPFLSHYLGLDLDSLDLDLLRTRLYRTFVDLAPADANLADPDRLLGIAQVNWNLSWDRNDRPLLPLRNGPLVSARDRYGNATTQATLVWATCAGAEPKDLGQELRYNRTEYVREGRIGTSGQALRSSASRLAVLAAQHLIKTTRGTPPSLAGAGVTTVTRRSHLTPSIVWDEQGAVGPADDTTPDLPRGTTANTPSRRSIGSALAGVATRAERLRGLVPVTPRPTTFSPATFLSGGSMTPTDVARYGVPRRIDFAGAVLSLDEVARRLCAEETVGLLAAGPGEGKSTYLHALRSALADRAIVFTWHPTAEPDWDEIQRFRELVAAVHPADGSEELPIVIVGELQTQPSREQEEALIDTFQSVPSGLATSRTSLVLAGRPAWLNRIRQRSTAGVTMRLVPLTKDEADSLVENLERAYQACTEEQGSAWANAEFPNLGQFLAMPPASRSAALRQGSSLVGPLLRAAYGAKFADRLRAEYSDLAEAEREAYLLVSLATSSIGGVSDDLLVSVCPDADVEGCSTGVPWLWHGSDGLHRARHEMIGRLVVEDASASTVREIGWTIRKVIDAAKSGLEARDLLRNVVHIYDEPQSLIPDRQRKTEPRFREAIRTGILYDRASWEQFEESLGSAGDLLAFSYFLHRLLPDKRGSRADYLLARSEHLLTRAEAVAIPGSPAAERASFYRILTAREGRRLRGQVVDDLDDVKTLIRMMSHSWPDSRLCAQVLSMGLSALKHCELDEDEEDEVAQAILEAWQRLRVQGSTRNLVYRYAPFVSRDLCEWPLDRRMSLWQAGWEFSRALSSPDGALACLIDNELWKMERRSGEQVQAKLPQRRRDVLSLSVVPGQSDAEVVLRYAEFVGADDGSARNAILVVADELAVSDDPTTRSMALHARAIVTNDVDDRSASLIAAMDDYSRSMTSRDEWIERGEYWKRALRELRTIDSEAASSWASQVAAVGRKFAI